MSQFCSISKMDFKFSIVLFVFTIAHSCGSIIPTVEVLQGPGSRTTLLGPDGGAVDSAAPGGTVVTNSFGTGLVAAGPAILPAGRPIVVSGPAGSIATSYTGAGPAIVPAAAAVPVAAVRAISTDEGDYIPDISEALGDDGSYRGEH
nr:uncharacterized protein LOC111505393 [Leptinotarsa decemlineata]